MTKGETEAFATRLSADEAERIRDALNQTDLSRCDLLARGFRYYMAKNPHDIPAFRPEDPKRGPLEDLGILEPETESDWTGLEDR